MIIGNPSVLAIESGITRAYERVSLRALGFFVIHVGGRCYGVHEPDATMLACSFDKVERRIASRGRHAAPPLAKLDAGEIANAFRTAFFIDQEDETYCGIPADEFRNLFYVESRSLVWAPDGDEAFDDGSYVLQFDVKDRVRVIAFTSSEDYLYDPATLSDTWLPAADFYQLLQRWHDAFEAEWTSSLKVSDDGGRKSV